MKLQIKILIGIVFCVFISNELRAQDSHGQFYTVTVREGISITAPGGTVISHDLTPTNQVFPEQIWNAYTTNSAGATVSLTITKFQHQTFTFFNHNTRIDLRIAASDSTANWTTIVDRDRTFGGFFSSGDTATVSAESFGPGAGELGITVRFLQGGLGFVISGSYVATLTGTITNK